jgi:hypothetical protein
MNKAIASFFRPVYNSTSKPTSDLKSNNWGSAPEFVPCILVELCRTSTFGAVMPESKFGSVTGPSIYNHDHEGA